MKNYICLKMLRTFGIIANTKARLSKHYVSLTPKGLSKTGTDEERFTIMAFIFWESPLENHVNYPVTHEELV